MTSLKLREATLSVVRGKKEYYRQWLFDDPIVTTLDQHNLQMALQKIMYKMVFEFASNYLSKWQSIMPSSAEVIALLSSWEKQKYRVGTYRTDFICGQDFQPRIIEITCRFAMNAFFHSATYNEFSKEFIAKNNLKSDVIFPYDGFFDHFFTYLNDSKVVYVLTGSDLRNESKLFVDIFPEAGIQVEFINYKELPDRIEVIGSDLIISELSHAEWLSLPLGVIENLASKNLINDPRTIFLIHDKRFFSVIGCQAFRKEILNEDEIALLEKFYIPTYQYWEAKENWEMARKNKDGWILKHRNMGKSQEVYAGPVTDWESWLSLFDRADIGDYILQEYVPQARIKGIVRGIEHLDYFAGTYLFFDDNYFGYGEYRTSSYPVSNKLDHGKAFGIILNANDSTIVERKTALCK